MHGQDDSRVRPLAEADATLELGRDLARGLVPGLVIWLEGELGAGKTTLTRGVLRALGFAGRVKSPTYSLVEVYSFSSFNLYHFDLYRLADPEEWEDAGFRDYFNHQSVCLVEWPGKAAGVVPEPDIVIHLEFAGDGRVARLEARTEAGRTCIATLETSA